MRIVAVLALAQTGCALFAKLDVGYAHAFAQAPERSAATFMGLRGKASDAIGQFPINPILFGVILASLDMRHQEHSTPFPT